MPWWKFSSNILDRYYTNKGKKVAHVYSPDILIGSSDFTLITPRYLELTLSVSIISLERIQRNYRVYAAVTIHTVPIFVLSGTHYCWVDIGGVDSKLAQGFCTWPSPWEPNPRPLILDPLPWPPWWQRNPNVYLVTEWCQNCTNNYAGPA